MEKEIGSKEFGAKSKDGGMSKDPRGGSNERKGLSESVSYVGNVHHLDFFLPRARVLHLQVTKYFIKIKIISTDFEAIWSHMVPWLAGSIPAGNVRLHDLEQLTEGRLYA